MNKRKLSFLVFLVFFVPVSGKVYRGAVEFPDSLSYPYIVSLYNDSTLLLQMSFNSPSYEFSSEGPLTRLRFTSLGYSPVDVSVPSSASSDVSLGKVVMRESAVGLREVVVSSDKIKVTNNGMDFTISNVQGTYIGNAGTLMDMLRWTPGVSVRQESVTVFGRGGSPRIYVNGVETNKSELGAIPSTNVSRIEVIRNPGAEYPMGTSSVILITTSTPLRDMVNLEVSENPRLTRAFSNTLRVTSYGKYKRFHYSAYLVGTHAEDRQSADYVLEGYGNDGTPAVTQSLLSSTRGRFNMLQWFAGANYLTKNQTRVLLQYSGSMIDNKTNVMTNRSVTTSDGTDISDYVTTRYPSFMDHNLTGLVNTRINGGTLYLTMSFLHSRNNTSEDYKQMKSFTGSITYNNYLYRMYTLNIRYVHKIPSFGNHAFGVYTGYTTNIMSIIQKTQGYCQNVKSSGEWVEAFYVFSGKKAAWEIAGGIRGRAELNITNEVDVGRRSHRYLNYSPNITIGYYFNKDYKITLSYLLTNRLPSYRQINPAIRVSEGIFYTTGNPSLKQSNTSRFTLSANIKGMTLSPEFYIYTNSIFNLTKPFGEGMFLTYPSNMGRSNEMLFRIEYNLSTIKNFSLYTGLAVGRKQLKYRFLESVMRFLDYWGRIQLNASYSFGKFTLFTNFRYETPQRYNITNVSHCLDLSIGADYTLLKGRLYMRLEVNDLFARSVTPSWKSYSPSLYQYRRNRYDTRGVALTIRYKFTSVKSSYNTTSSGSDTYRMD